MPSAKLGLTRQSGTAWSPLFKGGKSAKLTGLLRISLFRESRMERIEAVITPFALDPKNVGGNRKNRVVMQGFPAEKAHGIFRRNKIFSEFESVLPVPRTLGIHRASVHAKGRVELSRRQALSREHGSSCDGFVRSHRESPGERSKAHARVISRSVFGAA
jgi:hypothetical protein